MGRLATNRATKVDSEFTRLEKAFDRIASELARETDLTINLTGWLHDNIQNTKGDVDVEDRAAFNAKFTEVFTSLQTSLGKLQECYDLHNDDPAVYSQNLANFIVKYPSAEATLVDTRFK